MSQTVWLARHGNRLDFVHPEWFNTAPRRYDPPLSQDGFIQAAELAQRLKPEGINHIFTSPFLRTIQTANEVAKILELPIKLEAGLGEWHNPEWMTEMPEIHPQDFLADKYSLIDWSYQPFFTPSYPESQADVNRRTAKTIQKLVSDYSADILIIGHSASVYGATQALVSDIPDFKLALCCLTKIVKNNHHNSWDLEFYGDTSHLSPKVEARKQSQK